MRITDCWVWKRRGSLLPTTAAMLALAAFTPVSALAIQVTETVTYHDNQALWVLGQIAKKTCIASVPADSACDGGADSIVSEVGYGSYAQPLTIGSFGKLLQTRTYDVTTPGQLGTIKTIKDGSNNVTTAGDWYLGVPRLITFADGESQTADVDTGGRITSVTDENGYTTSYGRDAMGRVSSITYPAGDLGPWNQTTLLFQPVASGEYGIGPGHWRQTISTGNARKITYFDALWRPLVVREYDAADIAGTQRFTRFSYDEEGRIVFASYPGASDALSAGIWSEYDVLGRPISVSQDSELGLLTTTTRYLPGGITETTTPRGQVSGEATTTAYMALDKPSYDWPVSISHPEGAYTDIVRDVYGKPKAFTRRDNAGGVAITRSYVYNVFQELCRSVEPETGATLMGYDGAGNLAWSAAGLPATTACDTEGETNGILASKVTRFYDARNRIRSLRFADGRGNTTYTYFDDGKPASMSVDNGGDATDIVDTTYAYNERRLLTGERMQYGSVDWSVSYGYDANGNLATQASPGLNLAYAPNALGQPTQAGSYATGVSYFPNGAVKQFSYGNGIVHSMVQNGRQLPAHSSDAGAGTTAIDLSYRYDQNANVVGIDDALGRQNRTMTYDELDRLLSTQSVMFSAGGMAQYTYDVLDNISSLSINGRLYAYHYDASNRLESTTTGVGGGMSNTLTYDSRGNLAQKNEKIFSFDLGNRLRAVNGIASYVYDGAGRRVKDTTTSDKYSFYSQAGQLIYENDLRQAKSTAYVYLAGSLVARVIDTASIPSPVLLASKPTAAGSYLVSWSVIEQAAGYELQESNDAIAWATAHSGTLTSMVVAGKPTGNYYYRVRACSGAPCSEWSGTLLVTVTRPPSVAPSTTVPGSSYTGSYTVSWTAVTTASSYKLEESINGGSWSEIYSGGGLSQVVGGKAASSYAYRVSACNTGGCGPYSDTATVLVTLAPTGVPTVTAPSSSYTGSYTVAWTAATASTSYRLEESSNGGSWTEIQNGSGLSKAISGKSAGSYAYRVRACNVAGCGPYSATGSTLVTIAPATTSVVTAPSSNYSGGFTVTWTVVGAATSYRLEESSNSGVNWTEVYSGNGLSNASIGKSAGTYSYRVRGCNVAGCGPYSAVTATVVTYVPTAAPSITTQTSSGTGSYTVMWTSVNTATSYRLEESSGGAWLEVYNGGNLSTTIAGKGSGTYSYRARGCNVAGCGPYSVVGTTVVTLPPAASPTVSVPSISDTGNFTVSWSTVSTATSYRLDESNNAGGSWIEIYNGGAISQAVGGKGNGTYSYRARGCNVGGCGPYSASDSIVVGLPPPVPSIASAFYSTPSPTSTRYNASWNAVAGATYYEVSGAFNANTTRTFAAALVAGSYNPSATVKVRACNDVACSAWSAAVTPQPL